MSIISLQKKQFEEANKRLTDDEQQLLRVKTEIASLKKEEELLTSKVEEDRRNKTEKGLLYYSESKRTTLLNKAKTLPFSRQTIERLQCYDESRWNSDYVKLDVIMDFESVEKYVNDNTPDWERTPIAKIGKWFNKNG